MKSDLFIPITFQETRPDGAGTKIITATTPEQKIKVVECYDLVDRKTPDGARAFVKLIDDPNPLVLRKESLDPKRGYFLCSVALELEWSQPYFDELHRRTGFDGRGILPDLDLTPWHPWGCVCPTHDTMRIWTEHGHFCADIVVSSQDHDGKTAAERCDRYATQVMQGFIGDTKPCPQYIDSCRWGNGAMKLNPKWGKAPEYECVLGVETFFWAMAEWWLLFCANDAQREVVRMSDAIHRRNLKVDQKFMSDLHGANRYRHRSGITYDWNSHQLSWEAFQALQSLDDLPPPHTPKKATP